MRATSCMLPELENHLYNWIIEHRDLGHCVSGNMIRIRALQLFSEDPATHVSFQGSEGWFHRFLRRKNLVLRRVTTSGRELPKNVGSIIDNFLETSQSIFMIPNFDLSNLANMDETSNFSQICFLKLIKLTKNIVRYLFGYAKPNNL